MLEIERLDNQVPLHAFSSVSEFLSRFVRKNLALNADIISSFSHIRLITPQTIYSEPSAFKFR